PGRVRACGAIGVVRVGALVGEQGVASQCQLGREVLVLRPRARRTFQLDKASSITFHQSSSLKTRPSRSSRPISSHLVPSRPGALGTGWDGGARNKARPISSPFISYGGRDDWDEM